MVEKVWTTNSNLKQSLAHSSHQTRNVELVIGFVVFRDYFVAKKHQQHKIIIWIWYGPPLCYVDAYMFTRKGQLSTAKVSCLLPLPQQLYLQTSPESNGKFILNLKCNEAPLQFCGEVATHLLSALFLGQEAVAAPERYWCLGLVRCLLLLYFLINPVLLTWLQNI